MKVLGCDPGSLVTGYCALVDGKLREAGTLTPKSDRDTLIDRVLVLGQGFEAMLDELQPDVLAIESAFVGKWAASAMALSHVRGVYIYAARKRGIAIAEYSPTKVKAMLCGRGSAQKTTVRRFVGMALGQSFDGQPFDVSDAAAVALTHFWGVITPPFLSPIAAIDSSRSSGIKK